MHLSDDQMAAVVGSAASSFAPVALPTGRQSLPHWVRGAHVDWMNGCANAPTLTVKVRGNVRQWDGMVWSKVNGKCYMARHADGRAEVLYHDGGVFRAVAWRIFAGDEPVTYRWTVAEPRHGETMEQAATREAQKHLDLVKSHSGKTMQSYRNKRVKLDDCRAEFKTLDVTSQQGGFGGDGYLLTMDDGSERMLRGPWHGGAPDGFVEITVVDVEQDRSAWLTRKPWYRRGGTGTYVTEDLFLRIVAAHQPHAGVARVGHKYGSRLEPFNLDWDMPKALAYSLEHQRAQRGEPAGKHWRLYWDGSERYCGSLRIPTYGFLPEVTDLPKGAQA
jgi:hypothetical protein